jgi:hypothetical protein
MVKTARWWRSRQRPRMLRCAGRDDIRRPSRPSTCGRTIPTGDADGTRWGCSALAQIWAQCKKEGAPPSLVGRPLPVPDPLARARTGRGRRLRSPRSLSARWSRPSRPPVLCHHSSLLLRMRRADTSPVPWSAAVGAAAAPRPATESRLADDDGSLKQGLVRRRPPSDAAPRAAQPVHPGGLGGRHGATAHAGGASAGLPPSSRPVFRDGWGGVAVSPATVRRGCALGIWFRNARDQPSRSLR